MNYYEENMEFLSKRLAPIYNTVQEYVDTGKQIVQWDNQYNTIRVTQDTKKLYLQSIYDGKREIKKMLEKKPEQSQTIVLFSMVSLNLIKEIKKTYKKINRIVIIEPSVQVFKEFISKYSLKATLGFITDVKFSLIVQEKTEDMERALQEFLNEGIATNIAIINSLAYQQLYPEYLIEVIKLCKEAYAHKNINAGTINYFRYKWLLNAWRNIRVPMYSLYSLCSLFQKYPCVIVSAGPSLQKNIHLLEKLKKKAIIIAVGSAASILYNKNIRPHFIMGIDASVLNNMIYGDMMENESDIPMLTSRSLYYNVVNNYCGPKFEVGLAGSIDWFFITEYFYKGKPQAFAAQSALSVANVLHGLLLQAGAQKIIFMGQDLCYTDGKIHSDGSWSGTTRSLDDVPGLVKTKDVHDNEVWSDAVFTAMVVIFERMIVEYEKVVHLNATEGGVKIRGAENFDLQDILDNQLSLEPEADIEEMIKQIVATSTPTNIEDSYKLTAKNINRSVEKIAKITELQCKVLVEINTISDEKLKYKKIKYIQQINKRTEKVAYFQQCVINIFQLAKKKCELADQGEFSQDLLDSWQSYLQGLREYLKLHKALINEMLTDEMADFVVCDY